MLINLSNHPSSSWSTAQLEAAREEYETVHDMPFPVVPPAWEVQKVEALAAEYAKQCLTLLDGRQELHAIHVMGEMTFTLAFVNLMQQQNVVCLASTTERQVEMLTDGDRKVSFQFVRFRAYSRLS